MQSTERPKKIYREEPVKIAGIEVRHTYAGLVYLIDHYRQILDLPGVEKKTDRQYVQGLVDKYSNQLQLLKNESGERGTKTEPSPSDLPAGPADVGTEEAGSTHVADLHGSSAPA
jgi:hypothetical protein